MYRTTFAAGRRLPVAAVACIFVAVAFLSAFAALQQVPINFETKPRRVAAGSDPSIAVRDTGDIYLLRVQNGNLWYERSTDGGDRFGHTVRVNDTEGEVMSHAEATPRLYLRGGKPYAVWQTHGSGKSDSMKLRFSRSTDYGESFAKAINVDTSGPPASQSFFTMNVSPKGIVFVAWLDGREKGGLRGGAAVYLARSTDGGATFEKSVRVAMNSCPCCRPSIAFADEDTVYVGFRELFEGDVRDIAVAASTDGGRTWGSPARVAKDNWRLNGCPHSGPSLAVLGKRLFISWYTVHDNEDQSYVFLAHSDDGGRTFSDREWLSEGTVDPNHSYLVAANRRILAVFQAREAHSESDWGKVRVYVREISPEGHLSRLMPIGNLASSAYYPTMAYEPPGHVFLAWTESGDAGPSIVFDRGRLTANSEMGALHAD